MRTGSGSSSSKSSARATPANAPASTASSTKTWKKRKRICSNPLSMGAGSRPETGRRVPAGAFRGNRYRPPPMSEPARWGLRRTVLDAMDRLHLARPAVRLYELALAAKADLAAQDPGEEDDGLPLPPARLRAQIGPLHADGSFFLRSGRRHAELIRDLLAEHGTPMDELGALLDWGCGCGRVLRHWHGLDSTR